MPGGEFDHHSPDLQPVASMSAPKSHKSEIISKYKYSVMTHESVCSVSPVSPVSSYFSSEDADMTWMTKNLHRYVALELFLPREWCCFEASYVK